ncbi:hypothetical protein DL98DRAFT_659829 [Cadophora sp. DSE1049]|nr:hypothetical protein DL98DRAFT_659829 [Cadophora sp. DSE1049]
MPLLAWDRARALDDRPFVGRVLGSLLSSATSTRWSPLSNVQSLTIGFPHVNNIDGHDGDELDELLLWLKLKSLHKFFATEILESANYQEKEIEQEPPMMPTYFNMRHLTLQSSQIEAHLFIKFLRIFPALESLSYSNGNTEEVIFLPERFSEGMSHLKRNPHWRAIRSSMGTGESIRLGPWLSDKDRMLESILLLPPAIESLTLKNCEEAELSAILTIISHKRTHLRHLQYLDLGWKRILCEDNPSPVGPSHHPGFTKDEVAGLLSACKTARITMKITAVRPSPKLATCMETVTVLGLSHPFLRTREFEYPYDGYIEFCDEKLLDPATGRWYSWRRSSSTYHPLSCIGRPSASQKETGLLPIYYMI